jgi:hypothetical protein
MIFNKNDQWFLIKLNILLKWLMTFSQIQHGLLPYEFTSYLFIHLFT